MKCRPHSNNVTLITPRLILNKLIALFISQSKRSSHVYKKIKNNQ